MMKQILAMMALLLGMGQQAWADDVRYYERSWDAENKKVVQVEKTANAAPLSQLQKSGNWLGLGNGWYYVDQNITLQTLNIMGDDVHLILKDDTKLTCTGGVKLETGKKLSVYSQSATDTDPKQGVLLCDNYDYKNTAGIGGGENAGFGELIVHGGEIGANARKYGSGIGSGAMSGDSPYTYPRGTMRIYGGKVFAQGGESGAGIGGGANFYYKNSEGLNYYQYGGKVTVKGGEYAAGLGGGGGYFAVMSNSDAPGGTFGHAEIYGGELDATGGDYGAAIGSGNWADKGKNRASELIIEGGTITANSGSCGAGIGGGRFSSGMKVTIKGGTVNANGNYGGAGIGSGYGELGVASDGGYFLMTGGIVTANGHADINNEVAVSGLGGGIISHGGEAHIGGGTLVVIGSGGGGAIGRGNTADVNTDYGKPGEANNNLLFFNENGSFLKVSTSNDKRDINNLHICVAAKRKEMVRSNCYAKIEVCHHNDEGAASYTLVNDQQHKMSCKYCGYEVTENHDYKDGKCACGKTGTNPPETWTVSVHTASSAQQSAYNATNEELKVVKGQKLTLPSPKDIEGLIFMDWLVDPADNPKEIEMGDSEIPTLETAGTEIEVTKDMDIWARYRLTTTEEWAWADDNKSATLTVTFADGSKQGPLQAQVSEEKVDATATTPAITRYTAVASWAKNDAVLYQFSDTREIVTTITVELKDDADNSAVLEQNDGKEVDVVYERQLSAAKTASGEEKPTAYTVCLPYDLMLAENDEEYPENVSVYTLWSVDKDKREVTFSEDFPILRAGYAYVVVVNSGTVNLSAKGVTLHAQPAEGDVVYITGGDMKCGTWKGNFAQLAPSSLFQENAYVMQSDGLLHQVQSNAENGLKPFRGYLSSDEAFNIENFTTRFVTIADGDGTEMEVSIDAFVDDSDDNTVDGIIMVQKPYDGDGFYYDLQGRRLQTVPQHPGIYISNGAKVIVR